MSILIDKYTKVGSGLAGNFHTRGDKGFILTFSPPHNMCST